MIIWKEQRFQSRLLLTSSGTQMISIYLICREIWPKLCKVHWPLLDMVGHTTHAGTSVINGDLLEIGGLCPEI